MEIRAEGLTRDFGAIRALDSFSITVGEGELFGLVGPDGAGKTTVMRLLASIMEPTSGNAWVCGFNTQKEAEEVKERIGYMSQRFGLYPDLTVLENLTFYADIYGVPKSGRKERIERLLEFSRLSEFRKRRAGNLSGGMKQKLGLACALVHTPKVLLLDEPTNGVDPVSRRDFWRILQNLLKERVTIFVSTSYLDEAERCSRVGLLHGGKLIAVGTPEEARALYRGRIIEARTENPRADAPKLRSTGLFEDVTVFGGKVHVRAGADLPIERVSEALSGEGISFSDLRIREPGLEDVFLSMEGDGESPEYGATSVAAPEEDRAVAVSVKELTRNFGDFTAVDRVSFEVKKGEIFGFLGPNGAGKSTTIKMLCGLLAPTSGTGTVAGFDVAREPERIKESIGYMSQKFSLYGGLTVEENIDFFGGVYGIPSARKKERKEWVIGMAGLEKLRSSRADSLSTGLRRRLALGCAILHEPSVLFLDEPTSGVDPRSRRRFWDLIYDMAGRGVTVFVTTHYMDEAEFCERIGLIYRGGLIALASPDELRADRMKGDVIEVVCERPGEALDLVASIPSVREAALFGRTIHAVAGDSAKAAAEIRAALTGAGFFVSSVEKIPPTLEDVFVSLIEERDREAAG